eukprot:scpid81134/ scgid20104/ 
MWMMARTFQRFGIPLALLLFSGLAYVGHFTGLSKNVARIPRSRRKGMCVAEISVRPINFSLNSNNAIGYNRNIAVQKQAADKGNGSNAKDYRQSSKAEKISSGLHVSPSIAPGGGLAEVTVQPQKQPGRILAVGWFTDEQLTQSTIGLADFLSLAVVARRDAVLPSVVGNHLMSVQVSRNVPPRFRRGLKPRLLSEYFDLDNITRTMLTKGGSHLINAFQARKRCAGKWSILYVVSNWQYLNPVCEAQPDLLRIERAMMNKLQSAEHSKDTVDNNCTWVEKCLEPKLLSLGPFRNTVCAAFPKTRWTIESLVSQLDIFESSECLLLPIWYGMGRHGIVQAPQRAPTFPLTALKTSANLRRLSQRLLHLAGLGSNYTAVHVRMEHIRSQYRKMKARGELQTGDSKQFALNCFNALLKFLKETVHTNSSLILGSDQRSESLRHNQEVQNLRQKLLNDLREIPLRVITVDEIVEKYSSADNNRVLRNPGM